MKRILFVAEDVTLSQVVRLLVLARSLDPRRYEVHFACRHFDAIAFREGEFERHTIESVTRAAAHEALDKGKRIYDVPTLRRYVASDLRAIGEVEPDLVVSDFRLSMPVSARAAGVPFAAVINGYWSPQSTRRHFPVPDHPIVRVVGEKTAARYFPKAMPRAFAHFAEPVNALCKEYGLPVIGSLLEVLTYSDHTLYPDVPMLTPIRRVPPGHGFIGPLAWSPDVPLPPWWDEFVGREERPLVYITMGSSGRIEALPRIIDAVSSLPVNAVVATAGRTTLSGLPDNIRAAEFLPGEVVARAARLVVCNGGSSTAYQALGTGTPVLGIAANLDQHLAIAAIEACGAGIRLRSLGVKTSAIRSAIEDLLSSSMHRAAQRVAVEFATWRASELFPRHVDRILQARPAIQTG